MSETVNYKYGFFTSLLISGVLVLGSRSAPPQEKPRTPADGHDIHVLAPHKMDGITTANRYRVTCSNA